MSASPQSQATRMFSRVLGPYLVIIMAIAVAKVPDYQAMVAEFDTNPMLVWVTGAFTLLSGLVVIALHPFWRGAAAAIVSVLGWLTTLKGVAIMAFPGSYGSIAATLSDRTGLFVVDAVVVGLIGLYLTYVGWLQHD